MVNETPRRDPLKGGSSKTPSILSPATIRDIYRGGIVETPDLDAKRGAYKEILAKGIPGFLFTASTAEQKNRELKAFAEAEGLEPVTIRAAQLDPTELSHLHDELEDGEEPNG